MDYVQNFSGHWAMPFGMGLFVGLGAFMFLLIIWSMIWKGIALWKAARSGDKAWFIILLVVNTVGVLEIIYIYLINKEKAGSQTEVTK